MCVICNKEEMMYHFKIRIKVQNVKSIVNNLRKTYYRAFANKNLVNTHHQRHFHKHHKLVIAIFLSKMMKIKTNVIHHFFHKNISIKRITNSTIFINFSKISNYP